MTVNQWDTPIRNTKVLKVFAKASFTGGPWATVLESTRTQLNSILSDKAVHLTFEIAGDEASAQVVVDAATKTASFSFDGVSYSKAFDGNGLHGRTVPVADGTSGLVVRQFVFVPATPKVGDAKSRELGPDARIMLLGHELLHAAGLSNDEHTLEDLMCFPAEITVGNTAAADRLHPWGGLGQDMAPLYITAKTCRNLRTLWP